MSFLDEITPLKEAALRALQAADTLAKLDDVRVQYLGTNGAFLDLINKLFNHRQRNISFKQSDSHFAQRLSNIGLCQGSTFCEVFKYLT